ncbi:MAG TPA: RES family NAD+ phosphorylase [Nevskiaceae bacterium]|nr:RES family NAD+ phosphorylase [Nevskiaceae bacterium]
MAREADHGPAPRTHLVKGSVHRLVASRYPPVGVFDTARDEDELRMLAELESLTNDRLRQELGQIRLVPAEEIMVGPGCTPIMSAFCHPTSSRFSDGSFGVYYAALAVETAIAETRHHRERFLRDAALPAEVIEMRCYTTTLVKPMTRLPTEARHRKAILDPDSYAAGQGFGALLRARGAWGVYYDSVRHQPDGRCVGVLRPRALKPVTQTSHYRYYWDGRVIAHVERFRPLTVG